MATPLSAAMVAGPLRDRAERCLEGLLRQTALPQIEIVVVDISGQNSAPLRGSDHPAVRVICRPEIRSYAVARAECFRQANGEFIAFVEDHVVPEPGWAAAVLAAFRPGVSAVNYAFTNLNPATYASRASLILDYGPWMAPARSGPVRLASCNNIAYRRQALEFCWNDLDRLLEAEFLLQRMIRQAGGTIWLEASAKVAHENWSTVAGCAQANGALKQLLANRRAIEGRWSAARRCLYAGGMVLSPALHLWRLVRTLPMRPRLWLPFLTALPVICFVYSFAALREARGYLQGIGASEAEFLRSELTAARSE